MLQTPAADAEPATRPKISFAGVNKFFGDKRTRAATTPTLDDSRLDIVVSGRRHIGSHCRLPNWR